MSDHLTKSGSSTSSAGLLLRVSHADGRIDEFYLANGLTIGRTLANTVVLADDQTVDRTHARVDFGEDGSARLRCLGTDNAISLGNTTVRELGLTGGVAFHIGQTSFECIPGQRAAETGHVVLRGAACPHCGSKAVPTANPLPVPCPSCGQAVLALDLGLGFPTPFVVPIRFGDFQAQRFVTRGGMGLVLRGQAEVTQQPVAIKILLPGKGVDRQASERFKQEIALMKRVVHPNVVRLLSYGRAGLFNFLVMEWIDGHNLRDAIIACKQQQRLPRFDDVFPWLEQMCKGLAAIHAVGIVHRDIKPSNVLIAQDGRILVSDLGVAKRTDQGQTALTTTGQLPGTYEYMAPEQLAAPDTVDQRTDLYSLGVMFYELLTGERPVGAWLPASQVNPGVPLAVDRIVSRLLARKAENRYADIHELLAALSVQRPRMETGRITSAPEQVETPHDSFLGDLLTHLQAMGPENRYVDIHRLSAAILASYPTPAARPGTAETVAAQPPLGQPTSSVPEVKVERTGRQGEIAPPRPSWRASNQTYTACLGGVVFLIAAVLTFWCAGEFGGSSTFTTSLLVLGSGCLVLSVFQWIEVWTKVVKRSPDTMAIPPSPSGQATRIRSRICGAPLAIAMAWQFLIGQVKGVVAATYAQTRRLVIWCAAWAKGWQLARKRGPARLLLGVKLLEARTGSADAIARINEIKELIATDLPTIWHLRRLRNESRELTLRLAEEVLAGTACPPEAVPEYSAAVAAEKSHDEHRDRLRAMYTSLGPTNSAEWRRVAMGYGVLIAVVLLISSIFLRHPIPGQAPSNPMLPARGPATIIQPPDKEATIAAAAAAANTQGSVYFSKGEYDQAMAMADEAIRLDPKVAKYFGNRGRVHCKKKEYDAAIADYSDAIRLDPGYADAYNERGNAWLGKNELEEAISGVDVAGSSSLGKDYCRKAIADYSAAIRLTSTKAVYYSNRGLVHLLEENHDEAIRDYTEAIRLSPADAENHLYRGNAYFAKENYEHAITDYSEAIQRGFKGAVAYVNRAGAYRLKGDAEKALADYTEAIRLEPGNGAAIRGKRLLTSAP